MVNRISHWFQGAGSAPSVTYADDSQKQDPPSRWLGLMEEQLRQSPKLWLGVAFAVGVGVAWWIKRK